MTTRKAIDALAIAIVIVAVVALVLSVFGMTYWGRIAWAFTGVLMGVQALCYRRELRRVDNGLLLMQCRIDAYTGEIMSLEEELEEAEQVWTTIDRLVRKGPPVKLHVTKVGKRLPKIYFDPDGLLDDEGVTKWMFGAMTRLPRSLKKWMHQ